MKKIYYDKKTTSANTEYLTIPRADQDQLLMGIQAVNSYMQELSITKDKDIKDFINWYNKPTKTLPYNKNLNRYNSPQSFLAGILNNLLYGSQENFSLVQLTHVQNLLNDTINIIEFLETEYKIKLQNNKFFEKIMLVENLWVIND